MGPKYSKEYGKSKWEDQSSRPQFQPPTAEDIEKIIAIGDVELLVNLANRVGEALVNQDLKTNQIRNVFGTVRQIQMRWATDPQKSYREAILLRPKLAYFAEKEKKAKGRGSEGMETLQKVLEPALILVGSQGLDDKQRKERFERFAELFEAIVAYHKKYGGRDN
jgi:CRISPR-associated protein Csm2